MGIQSSGFRAHNHNQHVYPEAATSNIWVTWASNVAKVVSTTRKLVKKEKYSTYFLTGDSWIIKEYNPSLIPT